MSALRPGWFGKIPANGDFVARRLPRDFIDRWDEWLSSELPVARAALGSTFDTACDDANTVCFSLRAGVIDGQCWHGIMTPSADRIGRRFPLTIACRGAQPLGNETRCTYWSALIDAAVRTREPTCDADGLEQALTTLVPPDGGATETDCERWGIWSRTALTIAATITSQGLPRGAHFQGLLFDTAGSD